MRGCTSLSADDATGYPNTSLGRCAGPQAILSPAVRQAILTSGTRSGGRVLYPVFEITLVPTEIVRNRVSKLAIHPSSSQGLPIQLHGRHDLGTELSTASWSYQAQPHCASWLPSLTFYAACVAAAPSAPNKVKTALLNSQSSICTEHVDLA